MGDSGWVLSSMLRCVNCGPMDVLSLQEPSMQRRNILQWGAAALAVAASLGTAQAQSFTAKPIKLVIAFPAGGPTDITMRALADNASKILGQPEIVENKPGAGGTLPAQI